MRKVIQQTIKQLKVGNLNFVDNNLSNKNQDSVRRLKTLDGQNPFAVILTCSDSRVVPELIFDAGIGDLFVVRVAGNIANSVSIASIEYAIAHLKVELIVVLGHQNCGAVTAAAKGDSDSEHLSHLLKFIKPAISEADSEKIDEIAKINAQTTADKLNNDSKIIANAVNAGNLKIMSAFYNLESGKVNFFD